MNFINHSHKWLNPEKAHYMSHHQHVLGMDKYGYRLRSYNTYAAQIC